MSDDNAEFPGLDRSDSDTEVKTQGWFSRIFGSFFTGVLGLVFFLGSFVIVYKNEGTVDESKLAAKAPIVDAAAPGNPGDKFVAVTGKLATPAKLGDSYLKAAPYVSLTRNAEMYAWDETKSEKKEKQTGGSEKTITTYDYRRTWTGSPDNSNNFKVKSGHNNPSMRVKGDSWKADSAKLGVLNLDLESATLPSGKAVTLTNENTKGGKVNGNYLYLGSAKPGEPRVGDHRVSYQGIAPGGTFTFLGTVKNGNLTPYTFEGREFQRLFEGTKAEMLKTLEREYLMWLWGFRLLGFILCWGGMRMMMEPLNTVFDVLPFLGGLGRGITGFLTFPIAIVLTGATILTAWLMQNLFAMLAVGAVVLIGCIAFFGAKKAAA